MDVHLDPLGGWSGDMFAAACLDAFPDVHDSVAQAVQGLGLGPGAAFRLVRHNDGVLTGRRFLVPSESSGNHDHGPVHRHGHHDEGHHHAHDHHDPARDETSHGSHRAWADIRRLIETTSLPTAVKDHAIGIFTLLARAEAEVHGCDEADVSFHEVGAVDSIVDIVAAGQLIASIGASRWTASPLPLGGGRVRSAHGLMPIPAPATALLLRGLPVVDDGIAGERVTPTGAAIARYLLDPRGAEIPRARRIVASGTGFGTRVLPGISNCLRLLAFEAWDTAAAEPSGAFTHRQLGVITFEVDDQSAEDLSHGLDHIRSLEGVHDVIQSVAFGKKGRMATQVQVLVAPPRFEAAIAACFTETTTIGLRHHLVHGAALSRSFEDVEVEGRLLRVKAVRRPDGAMTGKTEASDVADRPGHATRVALRRAGEAAALARLDVSRPKRSE